jgi:beta-glucosidase-like glycosyl hydrolase
VIVQTPLSIADQIEALKAAGPHAAAAQLVMPALDLRKGEQPAFGAALAELEANPVCGYLFFGGDREQIRRITRSLRRVAEHKGFPRPLFTADVERGLGQIVAGGNVFPPLEAISATKDATRWAEEMGQGIARECLSVGIDWLFAPVADLADVAANPIVGSRSFGKDPISVSELVASFVKGVESTGALSCVKHFPGHGGTIEDSHESLPKVAHDRDRLVSRDLQPFARAFEAGASSLMTAHVAYPGLGDGQLPATLDAKLLKDVLRHEMSYDGLVVTDAFIMDGLRKACDGDEAKAAVMAIDAGCDLILYPTVSGPVIDALASAIEEKGWDWVEPSLTRILRRKSTLPTPSVEGVATAHAAVKGLAHEIARASQRPVSAGLGKTFRETQALRLVIIDDDQGVEAGADFMALARHRFSELYLSWLDPKSSEVDQQNVLAQLSESSIPQLFLIRCSIKAWKGRPGLHENLVNFLETAIKNANTRSTEYFVISLAGEKVMQTLPIERNRVLLAYGEGGACEEEALKTLLDRIALSEIDS